MGSTLTALTPHVWSLLQADILGTSGLSSLKKNPKKQPKIVSTAGQ